MAQSASRRGRRRRAPATPRRLRAMNRVRNRAAACRCGALRARDGRDRNHVGRIGWTLQTGHARDTHRCRGRGAVTCEAFDIAAVDGAELPRVPVGLQRSDHVSDRLRVLGRVRRRVVAVVAVTANLARLGCLTRHRFSNYPRRTASKRGCCVCEFAARCDGKEQAPTKESTHMRKSILTLVSAAAARPTAVRTRRPARRCRGCGHELHDNHRQGHIHPAPPRGGELPRRCSQRIVVDG